MAKKRKISPEKIIRRLLSETYYKDLFFAGACVYLGIMKALGQLREALKARDATAWVYWGKAREEIIRIVMLIDKHKGYIPKESRTLVENYIETIMTNTKDISEMHHKLLAREEMDRITRLKFESWLRSLIGALKSLRQALMNTVYDTLDHIGLLPYIA